MAIQCNIMPSGRMRLPIDVRRHLGLEDGGIVLVEATDAGILLRSMPQAVARAQAVAQRYTNASVDDFLMHRRPESGE